MDNTAHAVFAILALCGLGLAQTTSPVAATYTDYGVFASNGTATNHDVRPTQTAVGRGLAVRAAVGGGTTTRPDALATTTVAPVLTTTGYGIRISESGSVASTLAGATLAAGSSSTPANTTPVVGRHGIEVRYPVAQGSAAQVVIAWGGRATAGATAGASVDVDGDGTADWSGVAGTSATVSLPVTAGANGIAVRILSGGSAALNGIGAENYSTNLTVSVRPAQTGVTVTWASSGPQCLGALAGSDSQANGMLTLTLGVTGAARTGFGVLVLGAPAATPTALPFGSCQLLVDTSSGLASFTTDTAGDATVTLRARAVAFTMSFQAVTFGFDATGGSVLGSTNVQGLTCQ